jgi:Uma2 family endonuclease
MAETDVHRQQIIDLITALTNHFAGEPDVYVSGNLLMYYVPNDPTRSVAPDVFMVQGVEKRSRRTYKVWEEAKGPDVVIEITSASTRLEDLGVKKGLYEVLGVREYFLFDPLGEYLQPALQGYRLVNGEYKPLKGRTLTSQVLGMELRVEDGWLRLYDLETGSRLLTPAEEAEARQAAEARAAAAEAEVARLQAELVRLRQQGNTP